MSRLFKIKSLFLTNINKEVTNNSSTISVFITNKLKPIISLIYLLIYFNLKRFYQTKK